MVDDGAQADKLEQSVKALSERVGVLSDVDLLAADTRLNPLVPIVFVAVSLAFAVCVGVARSCRRRNTVREARRVFVREGTLQRARVFDDEQYVRTRIDAQADS